MDGHEAVMPVDLVLLDPERQECDVLQYAQQLTDSVAAMQESAKLHIRNAQRRYKKYYDKFVTDLGVKQGDKVSVCIPLAAVADKRRIKTKLTPKFHSPWYGPYEVLKVQGPVALLKCLFKPHLKPEWTSMTRIKPYHESDAILVQAPKPWPVEPVFKPSAYRTQVQEPLHELWGLELENNEMSDSNESIDTVTMLNNICAYFSALYDYWPSDCSFNRPSDFPFGQEPPQEKYAEMDPGSESAESREEIKENAKLRAQLRRIVCAHAPPDQRDTLVAFLDSLQSPGSSGPSASSFDFSQSVFGPRTINPGPSARAVVSNVVSQQPQFATRTFRPPPSTSGILFATEVTKSCPTIPPMVPQRPPDNFEPPIFAPRGLRVKLIPHAPLSSTPPRDPRTEPHWQPKLRKIECVGVRAPFVEREDIPSPLPPLHISPISSDAPRKLPLDVSSLTDTPVAEDPSVHSMEEEIVIPDKYEPLIPMASTPQEEEKEEQFTQKLEEKPVILGEKSILLSRSDIGSWTYTSNITVMELSFPDAYSAFLACYILEITRDDPDNDARKPALYAMAGNTISIRQVYDMLDGSIQKFANPQCEAQLRGLAQLVLSARYDQQPQFRVWIEEMRSHNRTHRTRFCQKGSHPNWTLCEPSLAESSQSCLPTPRGEDKLGIFLTEFILYGSVRKEEKGVSPELPFPSLSGKQCLILSDQRMEGIETGPNARLEIVSHLHFGDPNAPKEEPTVQNILQNVHGIDSLDQFDVIVIVANPCVRLDNPSHKYREMEQITDRIEYVLRYLERCCSRNTQVYIVGPTPRGDRHPSWKASRLEPNPYNLTALSEAMGAAVSRRVPAGMSPKEASMTHGSASSKGTHGDSSILCGFINTVHWFPASLLPREARIPYRKYLKGDGFLLKPHGQQRLVLAIRSYLPPLALMIPPSKPQVAERPFVAPLPSHPAVNRPDRFIPTVEDCQRFRGEIPGLSIFGQTYYDEGVRAAARRDKAIRAEYLRQNAPDKEDPKDDVRPPPRD